MEIKVIRHHFPSMESTNSWAKEHILSFDRDALTIVSTDKQTNGRGRLGRKWLSSPGNLCVSFCFFWKGHNILNIPQLMALNIVELLEGYAIKGAIKWPNDVLVDQKKIAGILCEVVSCGEDKGIILGVGLNVNLTKKELAAIDQPCCSLHSLGVEATHLEVLKHLSDLFIPSLETFRKEEQLFFLERYRSKIVHQPGDFLKGELYEGIDDQGFLLLKRGDHSVIRVASVIED